MPFTEMEKAGGRIKLDEKNKKFHYHKCSYSRKEWMAVVKVNYMVSV